MEGIIFFGPPGSGKDTQSHLLAERLGYKIVVASEALRQSKDPTVLEKMKKGLLVDDESLYRAVLNYVREKIKSGEFALQDKLVFNGLVRGKSQVSIAERLFKELGITLKAVILFHLDDSVVVERLKARYICPKCGRIYNLKTKPPKHDLRCDADNTKLVKRHDDNEEAILNRIRAFRENEGFIKRYYKKLGKLITIDASKSVEDVYKQIVKGIEGRSI